MKKSDQLKIERSEKLNAQMELVNKAKAENREMTDAEAASFDAVQEEIEKLDRSIQRQEQIEKNESIVSGAVRVDDNDTQKQKRVFSLGAAVRSLIQNKPFEGAEAEAHQRGIEAARAAGIGLNPASFAMPLFANRADGQTVTQDSGSYGGNTVSTTVLGPVDYLRPQPIVESLGAVFLTGLNGNVVFAKNKGGVVATWENEDANVTNTKNEYGKVEMTPRRLTVSVPVSLQNIMQSSFDIEAYTMMEIRRAIESEIDKDALLAVLNASGTGSVAIGTNGGPLTFEKTVDLETAVYVANANSARLTYVSNSKVRGKAKTTVLQSGQATYLLQNNEMNGYPFAHSNHVPSNLTKGTASGVCSALIFGDFSKLIVGQWGFMDISVDNLSRKREGYVEITANVYLDTAVVAPEAFAVCKDITTA